MVLAPMVLLYVGLSRGPSQDEQPIAAAPVSSTDAPVRGAILRTASRPVYPYSLIRGGAYSAEELDRALAGDRVASAHYAGFDRARVHGMPAQSEQLLYASYRVHDQIYWTRRPVRLTLYEALLTDGEHLARARCGNRLSPTPQAPVGPEVGLDVPEAGDPDPADIFSAPMLRYEVFPGLLQSHWFQAPESGGGGRCGWKSVDRGAAGRRNRRGLRRIQLAGRDMGERAASEPDDATYRRPRFRRDASHRLRHAHRARAGAGIRERDPASAGHDATQHASVGLYSGAHPATGCHLYPIRFSGLARSVSHGLVAFGVRPDAAQQCAGSGIAGHDGPTGRSRTGAAGSAGRSRASASVCGCGRGSTGQHSRAVHHASLHGWRAAGGDPMPAQKPRSSRQSTIDF